MADISKTQNHTLDSAELRGRLEKLAAEMTQKFGIKSKWEGDTCHLSGSVLKDGKVMMTEEAVTIEVYGEGGTGYFGGSGFTSKARFTGVKVRQQRPPGWGLHALQRSLAGFADWVLEEIPYLIPAEETIPVLAAVDAVYRSARSGRREDVEV